MEIKGLGGSRENSGRKSIDGVDEALAVRKLINIGLNNVSPRIFYVPVMNKKALENFNNSVINTLSYQNKKVTDVLNLEVSLDESLGVWGINDGEGKGANKKQFVKIRVNDIILFITKLDGYQCIIGVAYVHNTIVSADIASKIWDDEQYHNIITIKRYIKLDIPFKLSSKRKSIAVLEGVPKQLWHNSHDMFRLWNFRKKITKNRYSDIKLIDETDFIKLLLSDSGGEEIYSMQLQNKIKETKNRHTDFDEVAVAVAESEDGENIKENYLKLFKSSDINLDDIEVKTSGRSNISDQDGEWKAKTPKNSSKPPKNKFEDIDDGYKKIIGLLGERIVYEKLVNDDSFLTNLGIRRADIIYIDWFNINAEHEIDEDKIEQYNDKSVGKGCDILIKLHSRDVKIEVKSSRKKMKCYTVTKNEFVKMAESRKDFYLIQVDNMISKIKKSGNIKINIINDPIEYILANIFEKINNITLFR